ncbi:unnamed protein product [Clavelina lepadiformis]|uniref:cholesterol 7-desaturase n=1 Tax=Clavelina lepadiformis TaxID=159417 RepID=A0ABP0F5T0_CLALP
MITSYLIASVGTAFCSPNLLSWLGFIADESSATNVACVLFNVLAAILTVWLTAKIYRILFSPLDLYRGANSVGYVHHDSRIQTAQAVKDAQKRKKIGNSPPVFPNGWFRVLDSRSLEKGRVKSVYVFGTQLAVFRNKRGTVRIVDAYCPHLGANLAVGGKVVNSDCLECPFHGWKFSGETGKLVDVPYSQKVPSFVSISTWPCCEVNGFIYIWHHCDKAEPQWRVPEAELLKDFKYVGRTEHIVHAHIQDIPENGADSAHLSHLHKPVIGSDVEQTNDSFLNYLIRHGIQIERDILMWNNKTYLKKPVLMKEESALAKHRRWYQQFYSENSPRLDDQGNLFYPNKADVTDW